MSVRLLLLVAGSLALWVLTAIPARILWGETAAIYAAVALGLCLVPALATMIWTGLADRSGAEQQLAAVLGSTGIRMAVVLASAWALDSSIPYFQEQSGFLFWVLFFYLCILGLEMGLLLAGRRGSEVANKT